MKALYILPFLFLGASAMAQIQMQEVFFSSRKSQPTELTHAGDSSGRIFVVHKDGYIRILRPDAPNTSTVFLDISRKTRAINEQGMLGLAFHPKYKENGFFYVNYMAENPLRTIVSRFSVSPGNPDKADSLSEQIVMSFIQPFANHNGGKLVFGPDGYLYIASGDGGSGNDPGLNGQSLRTFLGKILRINVDTTVGAQNYGIPADNPFVGVANARPEIYAYGLRNPWRFSYDAPTNRWWIGDVGQGELEEIDTLVRGGNYGWRTKEGTRCTTLDGLGACNNAALINPVYEYGRANNDVSVTGGFVYRGPSAPSLLGKYIFGDYLSGRIWSLTLVPGGAPVVALVGQITYLSNFGVDENGDMYAVNHSVGAIYKIRDVSVSTKSTPAIKNVAIRVLPIPARNEIAVHVKGQDACGNKIQILDLGGKVLKTGTLAKAAGKSEEMVLKMDVSALPEGTYFASQPCGGKAMSTKFIIAR